MIWLRRIAIGFACATLLVAAVWQFRAPIFDALIEAYFSSQGVASDIQISRMDRAGLSGRFVLGETNSPAFAAESIEVVLNKKKLLPEIVAIHIVNPIVRARIDSRGLVLPSIQGWIDSLTKKTQTPTRSRFISDDLAISLSSLRALVTTPGGKIEIDADARVHGGTIVFAQVKVPAVEMSYGGAVVAIEQASLDVREAPSGYAVRGQIAGSLNAGMDNAAFRATGIRATLIASGIKTHMVGGTTSIMAASAQTQITASGLHIADATFSKPDIDLRAQNMRVTRSGMKLSGDAELHSITTTQMTREDARHIADRLPFIATDAAMRDAFAEAMGALKLTLNAHISGANGCADLRLSTPAVLEGANGTALHIHALQLDGSLNDADGSFDAQLKGTGLPEIAVTARHFRWKNDGASVQSDVSIQTQFDWGQFHGVKLSAAGDVALRNRAVTLTLASCAQTKVQSVRSDRKIIVSHLSGAVCPFAQQPLLTTTTTGWKFSGLARGLSLGIPMATTKLSNAEGQLFFERQGDAPISGQVQIADMRISDNAKLQRYRPINGTGSIVLNGDTAKGRIDITDGLRHTRIGHVVFTHALARNTGKAVIDIPHLEFRPDNLQPADLSPLLASFTRATGDARFSGAVSWTTKGMTSHGVLNIGRLDFVTPLGLANSLRGKVVLKSLLPPITEDGQEFDIAKIDWTLPITSLGTKFSITPDFINIESATTNIASGTASLDPFRVRIGPAQKIESVARLRGIDLAQLVAATNVGKKVRIEGRVSGAVPFSSGPKGLRVAKGRLELVGPGRLAIDPALWTKASSSINGVQNFAYQALENLIIDSMTADINSVSNGRMQIVFHIKGHSDPPKSQDARISLFDLIRGTAFDKPIALPKGTPIDLTLDTSLNFDELLRSYREAWSNTLDRGPHGSGNTK